MKDLYTILKEIINFRMLYSARYLIIFLFVLFLSAILYLNSTFIKTYKLEANIYFENLFDTKKLHSNMTNVKINFYDKLDRSGYENVDGVTIGYNFKKIYHRNHNEFVDILLESIYSILKNYSENINLISKNKFKNRASKFEHVIYNNNDRILLLELYNHDKTELQKTFKDILIDIDKSVKDNLIQNIQEINTDVEAYAMYKRQMFEYMSTFDIDEAEGVLLYSLANNKFEIVYILEIIEKGVNFEKKLIEDLKLVELFDDNINYKVSSKEFPAFVYILYSFILSIFLGIILNFYISTIKKN